MQIQQFIYIADAVLFYLLDSQHVQQRLFHFVVLDMVGNVVHHTNRTVVWCLCFFFLAAEHPGYLFHILTILFQFYQVLVCHSILFKRIVIGFVRTVSGILSYKRMPHGVHHQRRSISITDAAGFDGNKTRTDFIQLPCLQNTHHGLFFLVHQRGVLLKRQGHLLLRDIQNGHLIQILKDFLFASIRFKFYGFLEISPVEGDMDTISVFQENVFAVHSIKQTGMYGTYMLKGMATVPVVVQRNLYDRSLIHHNDCRSRLIRHIDRQLNIGPTLYEPEGTKDKCQKGCLKPHIIFHHLIHY